MGKRAVSPGVKRPGRVAEHSPPSSVEAKTGGDMPPLLNMSSWRAASLIKHRDVIYIILLLMIYADHDIV
jgi:hypothetical protein